MDTKSMLRRLSTGCFQGYGRRTGTWTLSQNRFHWVFNAPFVLRTKDRSVACGRYVVPARMRLRPSLVKQTCGVNILDNPKPVEIIKK